MAAPPFYATDLARVHAAGFANIWDAAAPFLADLARVPVQPAYVADLGCGDGRMLEALQGLGVPGCGCDVSPAMVALARARGLQVACADAAQFHIPAATLVLALGEVLAYVHASKTALEEVAHNAWQHLSPGGHLVFDLLGPDAAAGQGWRQGEDWFVASRSTVRDSLLDREIVAFSRHQSGWRRTVEHHQQRLYEAADVALLLERIGYDVKQLSRIGDACLLPGRFALLARKS